MFSSEKLICFFDGLLMGSNELMHVEMFLKLWRSSEVEFYNSTYGEKVYSLNKTASMLFSEVS